MKVVLLAGGLGTRIREETELKPKPMIEVGHKPLLWHLMKFYSSFGYNDFVVCAGYKKEVISDWIANYQIQNSDFTVQLGQEINFLTKLSESDWKITLADTGLETMTGGRIKAIEKYIGNETFMCTYGDGLSDVDILKLLKFHKSHGKYATVTVVKPESRFGVLDIDEGGSIHTFKEKPQALDWVNGGFFCFEPQVFDYLSENSILEQEPMRKLAEDGQLMAYNHSGFWQPMDTFRELTILNNQWNSGIAPWKRW
jgi:glucose-1-phosphate cytidylyltransferase